MLRKNSWENSITKPCNIDVLVPISINNYCIIAFDSIKCSGHDIRA